MRLSIVFLLVLVTAYCQFDFCEGFDVQQTLTKIKEVLEKGLGDKLKKFFKLIFPESGQFQIDGTPLVITFFADNCEVKIVGKRNPFEVRCPADVTEIITLTSRHCVKSSQKNAVECATKLVLKEIQKNIETGNITGV
ncbi:uncharacterized protein LOC106870724 [Octopus bimaculoides]|uniref:Uncharacterized protein n=1 Tax=Octopus bimaculoides TaxID=37653 RepID=A0A0L8HI86_OCTBM|nr:uncharacterized protein LOC106870724 [Octopus bimaculoides]|eukprot:XP_014772380.1 PREDICTED: uncharacterized protein LOC106870724 [Octopus bimaculoides]